MKLLIALLTLSGQAADGALIHSMDDLKVRESNPKGRAEAAEGKSGKAVKFTYADGGQNAFCMTPIRGTAEWDKAAGFSFWVKGDGSKRLGGIQFIWNEDYAARYDLAFPIDGTEWKKVVVAWRDLVPVLPGAKFLDPKGSHPPSKLSALWFGKWWYWRDYGAHSFTVDEMRLEASIAAAPKPEIPASPLERTLAKLKAGKPVTIVTMGDSLTDYNHWANKPVNWPTTFVQKLKEKYKVDAKIVNPAIGGTQLRQGIVLLPRWLAEAPEPDLVTVLYGYNDWDAGMRGDGFRESVAETIDRIRLATRGKSDVLVITTTPALERWTTMGELSEAVRAAARETKAAFADTEKAFHAVAEDKRASLFCSDKTHLGPAGHETVAASVLAAIESSGR